MDGSRQRPGPTGPAFVNGVPRTSMMRPRVALPTGTVIGAPVFVTIHATAQAVGRTQGNRAYHAVAQLLLNFQRQIQPTIPASS